MFRGNMAILKFHKMAIEKHEYLTTLKAYANLVWKLLQVVFILLSKKSLHEEIYLKCIKT